MSNWKDVPASGALPPYRLFTGELQKPSLDDRQYRTLELQNGLRAVLIHDLEADKAAVCLLVTIGHNHDPIDAPGMAHFCEHMISKGSEQYPDEDGWISFVNANGGTRNAATGPMTTDYWCSINPSKLGEALSRLAAFQCAPLFTESLTAREINAVDSEFKRNLQNDIRRILQLTKSLSVSDHPWRKFGTGNFASLSGVGRKGEGDDESAVLKETRRRLLEWWQEEYCASRMGLVVIGKESLDELTSMVVPPFSKIINRGLDPRPAIKQPLWGPEHKGAIIFAETVKDMYGFSVQFELPDMRAHYQTRPTSFLAHFLGHEGRGSICAYLKKQGWLLTLTATDSGDIRSAHIMKVDGTLTLEGYLHYDRVLKAIFDYIDILRGSFPLEPYHYAEVSTMAETRFRFKEKVQPHKYAVALARDFGEPYPPEWHLSGPYLYRGQDEAILQELLESFRPENARVVLMAKVHREEVVGSEVQWLTEKWYGTRYHVRKIEEDIMRELSNPNTNQELFLPAPNPFIPTDLSVDRLDVPEPAKFPTLVVRSKSAQLWHKKDDQFWVPKASVDIILKSPIAYATARHATLSRIFVDLVDDALSEVTYDADLAGLSYSVTYHDEGLSIGVGGYNDKLHVLLRTVLEKLRGLSVDSDRMKVIVEKLKRDWTNYYLGQPSNLSNTYGQWLLMQTVWSPAEKLTELEHITASDIERHRDDLLSRLFIEILVNGNLTRERSLHMLAMTEECLRARPLLPAEIPTPRSLLLPTGSNYILRKRHENAEELNSSVSYACQFGESADIKLRCIAALIKHMIYEPTFSTLRTKEQLGYVVMPTFWSINNSTLVVGIKVQSTRAPWYVESRIEAFLEAYSARLSAMSADEFATHKEGLIVKKLERVKNLGEETARFWSRIRAGHYDFLRHETDATVIRTLTLEEVVAVYNAYMHPSLGVQSRKKYSVQLVSQQMVETPPEPGKAVMIVDESVFKAGLACAPAATPVISDAFTKEHAGLRAGPGSGGAQSML